MAQAKEPVVNIYVAQTIHKRLRIFAAIEERTMNDVAETALSEYFARYPLQENQGPVKRRTPATGDPMSPKATANVYVSREIRRRLKQFAAFEERKMGDIAEDALIEYFEQHSLRGKNRDPAKDAHYQAKRQAKQT